MKYAENRNNLVNWLRKQLIGPFTDQDKLIGIPPLDRYPTAVLFPIIRDGEGLDPAMETENDEEEDSAHDINNDSAKLVNSTVRPRRYIPPSSVGFSFFAQGNPVRLQVIFSAAQYSRVGIRDEKGRFTGTEYKRQALGGDSQALVFQARMSSRRRFSQRQNVLGGKARINILWRPFTEGWLVTLTFFNTQELKAETSAGAYSQERNEKSLFEAGLRCVIEEGRVGTYPVIDKNLLSAEELELELQYKDRHIYAMGHGAAVDWQLKHGRVKEIHSEFLPRVEVPQVTADVMDEENATLSLFYLASSAHRPGTIDRLEQFVGQYAGWINGQKHKSTALSSDERLTAKTIIRRMETALQRMQAGILLLRSDPLVIKSFKYANLAMLNQMRQSDKVKGRKKQDNSYKWRPFQLAFLLMTIQSTVNENDEFRDTVDLIWFPTGGGKTEAYLGLTAFITAWRRLKFPSSGGGTTVFMRYTLRLLTVQQYKRATRMICALELIRRQNPELGTEAVTIGLWVGAQTSPNSFINARRDIQKAAGNKKNLRKLVLDSCPWCGAAFTSLENYISTEEKFNFRCSNPECEFGRCRDDILPCNVVDEALYKDPPTLLLATVDKFARLAWDEKAGAFFGFKPGNAADILKQLFWGAINALLVGQSSSDGCRTGDFDLILGYLKSAAAKLDSRLREPLLKLSNDLKMLAGFGDSTITELFERHPKSFSRLMTLFFLRENCADLLEFNHPLLKEKDYLAAAILFAARDGWLNLPLELRDFPGLPEAVSHRMAAMAHRMAETGLKLGTPPPRPKPLIELFELFDLKGKKWNKNQREAALFLARDCKWPCIQTTITLGRGEYRMVIDGKGTRILVNGEKTTLTTEVDAKQFLSHLSRRLFTNRQEQKTRVLLKENC